MGQSKKDPKNLQSEIERLVKATNDIKGAKQEVAAETNQAGKPGSFTRLPNAKLTPREEQILKKALEEQKAKLLQEANDEIKKKQQIADNDIASRKQVAEQEIIRIKKVANDEIASKRQVAEQEIANKRQIAEQEIARKQKMAEEDIKSREEKLLGEIKKQKQEVEAREALLKQREEEMRQQQANSGAGGNGSGDGGGNGGGGNDGDNDNKLESMDFRNIIGGPLKACVDAQQEAADATFNYMTSVMLDSDTSGLADFKPVMMHFCFIKNGVINRLEMPLMSILPIPYMNINYVDLNFEAMITYCKKDTQQGDVKLKACYPITSRQLKQTGSAQATRESQNKEVDTINARENINIRIHATTSDQPAGLSRLIEMLDTHMTEFTEVNQSGALTLK